MSKKSDVRLDGIELYFLKKINRIPYKLGKGTTTHGTVARVKMRVRRADGCMAEGWGEVTLGVTWTWPSERLTFDVRDRVLKEFCRRLAAAWSAFDAAGHPIEIGHKFLQSQLPELQNGFNAERNGEEPLPWLAALVCCAAFDLALHDAYGVVNHTPIYRTYNGGFMNDDLSAFLVPAKDTVVCFDGKYPEDFIVKSPPDKIPAWHAVGASDPLDSSDLTGALPDDGYPVTLEEWVERDGLRCLKVKLLGVDAKWDYDRLVKVGNITMGKGVDWMSADFNCMVKAPEYVNDILDRLFVEHPRIYGMMLYVEQPFPYALPENRIDVHSISARKPLFLDESAHSWKMVRLGRGLGWTGVALKTCKTQTGALLALSWAGAHGMALMVQDLTNPMLAQIPHCLMGAHANPMMGLETNSMQFCPDLSKWEEKIHPGIYKRHHGCIDISSLKGPGFGYRVEEIGRPLPEPEVSF